jgi:hypothetical protein
MDGVVTQIMIEYGHEPCTKQFTGTSVSTSDHASHGNVFRPCVDGEVTSIEIEYWGAEVTGRTLNIYDGVYSSGATPIYTQSGITLAGGEGWKQIDLSSPITLHSWKDYTFIVDAPSPVRQQCSLTNGGGVFGGTVNNNCSIGYKVHTTTADATGLTLELFNGNTVSGSALAYTQSGITLPGGYGDEFVTLTTPFPVTNGSQYTFQIDVPSPVGIKCGGITTGEWAWMDGIFATTCAIRHEVFIEPAGSGLTVQVDIKPGGYPNCIKAGSRGRTPVAILGTADFDITTVDPATVILGDGTDEVSPIRWAGNEDVNEDGFLDLVFHFSTADMEANGLLTDGGTMILSGELKEAFGGLPFEGSDVVHLAGDTTCS